MQRNRRALLRASGLALVGGLAGCSNDDGPDGTDTGQPSDAYGDTTTTETDAPESTDTATPTTTDTATPTATATATPASDTVEMANIGFDPMTVRVSPGTEVTWVNRDGVPHNVQSDQFNERATQWDFRSDTVGGGGTVTYTFESAGTYEYYCTVHGQNAMCGVVLVGGADRAGPLPCE